LLCGEGGIGKSRIAEQLRERIGTAKNFRVRYQCSPFHTNSALQPAIEQLEHAASFADDDDDDKRLTKLEELLRATTPDLDRVMQLFAPLLNISTGKRYPTLHMTADVIKRHTLEALADQAVALSRINPVYWLIEDTHWVDPTLGSSLVFASIASAMRAS
jgi:predicted ATPase